MNKTLSAFKICIQWSTLTLAAIAAPWAQANMPASGACAFLMTLPVPYGASVNTMGETGYNLIGKITLSSASAGVFSGRIVNPVFQTNNSPYIRATDIIDLDRFQVQIVPMSPPNGFLGGYKMTATGKVNGNSVSLEWTAVPNSSGKSLLIISSGTGTPQNPGLGPGSGVCQF